MREDPELTALVPRLKPARVTVTLADGRRVSPAGATARAATTRTPSGADEIRSKFRELAGLVLSPAAVARAWRNVERLDDLPRLGHLVDSLREDRGR